jgi:hypothetical protein
MTMVRLNETIKGQVVENLMNKKYVKENLEQEDMSERLEKMRADLEKLAYEAAFDAPLRKVLTSATAGMFPMASQVSVRIIKGDASNYYDTMVSFGDDMPIPFRNSYQGGRSFTAVLDQDHPYVKALAEVEQLERDLSSFDEALTQKKYADRRRIRTVMDSVTTVKRLVEVWPEVADYLPENVSGPGGELPAEVIASLNEALGLTKKE